MLGELNPRDRTRVVRVSGVVLALGVLVCAVKLAGALARAKGLVDAGTDLAEVFAQVWAPLVWTFLTMGAVGLWVWGWVVSRRYAGPGATAALVLGALMPWLIAARA